VKIAFSNNNNVSVLMKCGVVNLIESEVCERNCWSVVIISLTEVYDYYFVS
jgi:hypothetical protein